MENEAIFRDTNRQINDAAERIFSQAQQTSISVGFYCECADSNCRERIEMSPEEFENIHRHEDQFAIKPKHVVAEIETVVSQKPGYWIVHKTKLPEDLKENRWPGNGLAGGPSQL